MSLVILDHMVRSCDPTAQVIGCFELCTKARACLTGSARFIEAPFPASCPAIQSIKDAKGASTTQVERLD